MASPGAESAVGAAAPPPFPSAAPLPIFAAAPPPLPTAAPPPPPTFAPPPPPTFATSPFPTAAPLPFPTAAPPPFPTAAPPPLPPSAPPPFLAAAAPPPFPPFAPPPLPTAAPPPLPPSAPPPLPTAAQPPLPPSAPPPAPPVPEYGEHEAVAKEASFSQFYSEVKAIEERDSVYTSKQQIDRLLRPGATYFNLNPFDVLNIDHETPLLDIKKKYRQMSILVHPDKNPDDGERAQKAFDAVKKAYNTLESEEGYKRCLEIIEEAKVRTEEMVENKRKQLKKEKKPVEVPEDDPEKYKHAVYVHTCKLFADLERLRQEREARDMHDRKRKAQEEAEAEEQAKEDKEWQKNYEETRTNRVESWRSWTSAKGKKSKGTFRPPKPKLEKREPS